MVDAGGGSFSCGAYRGVARHSPASRRATARGVHNPHEMARRGTLQHLSLPIRSPSHLEAEQETDHGVLAAASGLLEHIFRDEMCDEDHSRRYAVHFLFFFVAVVVA
jgi:hypothetical protein